MSIRRCAEAEGMLNNIVPTEGGVMETSEGVIEEEDGESEESLG